MAIVKGRRSRKIADRLVALQDPEDRSELRGPDFFERVAMTTNCEDVKYCEVLCDQHYTSYANELLASHRVICDAIYTGEYQLSSGSLNSTCSVSLINDQSQHASLSNFSDMDNVGIWIQTSSRCALRLALCVLDLFSEVMSLKRSQLAILAENHKLKARIEELSDSDS